MAKNFVQPGDTLTYTNTGSAAIVSGAVVVMGAIIGIAIEDIPVGQSGTVHTEKVWRLPKGGGVAMTNVGAAVFWDTDAKAIVAGGGSSTVPAGIVAAPAAAAATVVNVKINVAV